MIEQTTTLAGIIVVVEVIKKVTEDKITRWLPLISLLLGIGTNLMIAGVSPENILNGVLLGGAAAGIYDFGSKTVLDR